MTNLKYTLAQRLLRAWAVVALLLSIAPSCSTDTSPASKTQSSSSSQETSSGTEPIVAVGGISSIDSLLNQQKGRWVLVNVWATWCRPCVAETPDLVALHQSLSDKPFSLVGVSADYMTSPTAEEALRKVRAFGTQHNIRYPNVIYSGSTDDLTARFALSGSIPATILYDPQGREVERWVGRLVESDFSFIRSKIS